MPERLQLSRKKGFRLPLGAKSVARPHKWGNPFKVGHSYLTPMYLDPGWVDLARPGMVFYPFNESGWRKDNPQTLIWCETVQQAVSWFGVWTRHGGQRKAEAVRDLCGLDLACWCPLDQPCHADVLLEIANG